MDSWTIDRIDELSEKLSDRQIIRMICSSFGLASSDVIADLGCEDPYAALGYCKENADEAAENDD